jgi:hypothetical protein
VVVAAVAGGWVVTGGAVVASSAWAPHEAMATVDANTIRRRLSTPRP